MLLNPKDLDVLIGEGGRFEEVIWELIHAEARIHGVSPTEIQWDHRSNRADGGCDIIVKRGHDDPKARFLPDKPSIWSVKSGQEGTQPSSLSAELRAIGRKHLIDHLKGGGVYVWCALKAIENPERLKMEKRAAELAKKLKFGADQILFRWRDHVAVVLNSHPNVLFEHLPRVADRLNGVETLDHWRSRGSECWGMEVTWVSLAGRDQEKRRIQEHLLGAAEPAVLQIAGLSGSGKTRTVLQACLDHEDLKKTLYVPDVNLLSNAFYRHLESPDCCARVIIDEVPIEKHQALADRFRASSARIRIVSIGPARRDQPHRRELILLQPPQNEAEVAQVVKAAVPAVSDEVAASIARVSGQDLRLALLVSRVAQEHPEFRYELVDGLDAIWKRITTLFADYLKDVTDFPAHYGKLTVAIDIGRAGEYRRELDYITKRFELTPDALDRTINAAHQCGLGVRTPRFFEAAPRALALWVFREWVWCAIEPSLDIFLKGMSDRLLRRFLERCQEVDGPRRKEVLDRVGHFFLSSLGQPNLMRLSDRESSRVFEAWAELDPERGLPWLVQATENATAEELGEFGGSPDGSGGWRGRRQIVWLCEHLACFNDHFWDCERVLFRLAQVETEESVGNNSRNTWKAMFLPILSNTEVPFPERLRHILQRLREATEQTLDLVLSAALKILDHHGFRISPPTSVGGRIVPDEWRPRTRGELFKVEAEAGRALLAEIGGLRPGLRRRGIRSVIENVSRFLYRDLLAELQDLMRGINDDEEFLRALRAAIDQVISLAEPQDEQRKEPAFLPALKQWRHELNPHGLREQIIDLTSRDYWSVYHNSRRQALDEPGAAYREAALAILDDPALLDGLAEWLSSEQCRSGGPLGFELGKADEQASATALVLRWLSAVRAMSFAASYVRGASVRLKELPQEALPILEDLAQRQPGLAVQITIESDLSQSGFERIMQCLSRLDPGKRGMLRTIAFGDWPKCLSDEQKDRLLVELEALVESVDPDALAVAFDLLAGWAEHGKAAVSPRLAKRGLRMLELAGKPTVRVEDYNWKIVAELLITDSPGELARILADVITDVEASRFQRADYAQHIFRELARHHPSEAMQAIGRWVMDERRGVAFCFWEFRSLFDSIGLDIVRPWVQRHGAVAAVRIARHLDGPHLDDEGNPIVPQLADWLLTEFEKEDRVLREFCMGRHSGVVRSGHARDHREEIEALVKPFGAHSARWVQKWVKYELEHLQFEIKHDNQHEDERERT